MENQTKKLNECLKMNIKLNDITNDLDDEAELYGYNRDLRIEEYLKRIRALKKDINNKKNMKKISNLQDIIKAILCNRINCCNWEENKPIEEDKPLKEEEPYMYDMENVIFDNIELCKVFEYFLNLEGLDFISTVEDGEFECYQQYKFKTIKEQRKADKLYEKFIV